MNISGLFLLSLALGAFTAPPAPTRAELTGKAPVSDAAVWENRGGTVLRRKVWLKENAARFGFFQPYPDGRSEGYAPEKWHWSYAPLSDRFLDEYLRTVRNEDISGFAGSDAAPRLDMVGRWVDIRRGAAPLSVSNP